MVHLLLLVFLEKYWSNLWNFANTLNWVLLTSPTNLVQFRVFIEKRLFAIHDRRVGEVPSTDFSKRFSLITREWSMLETCKLAQKILHVILRRMVCNLSRNKLYLKSQFGEIGRFSCILGFFPIFMNFSRENGGRGLSNRNENLRVFGTRWRYSKSIHD